MSDQQLRDLQGIIKRQEEELDGLRARVAKLERGLTDIANFGGEDFGRQPVDNAHHLAFVKDIALAALETPDE